jgi:hypothetical protein
MLGVNSNRLKLTFTLCMQGVMVMTVEVDEVEGDTDDNSNSKDDS